MNRLLIGIAQRLVNKAIEINNEDYNVKVSVGLIGDTNAITVIIFDKDLNNVSFYLYDDSLYNESHISQFRYILRKIRKRVL